MTADSEEIRHRVRAVRAELHAAGPKRTRPVEGDFERVALPAADGDILQDTLVAHGARAVIEIGLAYGSSALAIGEALCSYDAADATHIVIDPFQAAAYDNVGWDALRAAGLPDRTILIDLGWRPVAIGGRLTARRLPDELVEPSFTDFKLF